MQVFIESSMVSSTGLRLLLLEMTTFLKILFFKKNSNTSFLSYKYAFPSS